MGEVAAIRWENPLEKASFPLIVEDGEPRAVVVDIKIFRQLEAILDNLLATDAETEDHFLGQSPVLRSLAEEALASGSDRAVMDWRRRLHECAD